MVKRIKIRHATDEDYEKRRHSQVGTFHRFPTRTSPGTGMFAGMGPLGDEPAPDQEPPATDTDDK